MYQTREFMYDNNKKLGLCNEQDKHVDMMNTPLYE